MKQELSTIKVLLIDDDEDDYIITRDILREIASTRYELDWENNYDHAISRILERKHDVYLVDYRLGSHDGITLISTAIQEQINAPLILLTGKSDSQVDVSAMEKGAADFLVKGEITPQMMERAIRYAINNRRSINLLKESELKYKQLFERSIDPIYITDIEHTILDINPSFVELFKFPKADLIGQPLNTLFQNKQQFQSYDQTMGSENQIKDFDAELMIATGQKLQCQLTAIIRSDSHGNHSGYQGYIHDMTLRKKAESELMIAEKLSMSGKMARSIAHEVRNPLTNLGLALEQLEEDLDPQKQDIKSLIEIIRRNSDRIEGLVKELMNSSKPKELKLELYDVHYLLENVLKLITDRVLLMGMKIKKQFDQDIPFIMLDPEQMQVGFLNILVNALEAMQENQGVLTISTRRNHEHVVIKIADNGHGIKPEDLTNLFDPFFTRKDSGTGLGLTSAKGIIDSHGGQVEVKSEVGIGTTFKILLPIS